MLVRAGPEVSGLGSDGRFSRVSTPTASPAPALPPPSCSLWTVNQLRWPMLPARANGSQAEVAETRCSIPPARHGNYLAERAHEHPCRNPFKKNPGLAIGPTTSSGRNMTLMQPSHLGAGPGPRRRTSGCAPERAADVSARCPGRQPHVNELCRCDFRAGDFRSSRRGADCDDREKRCHPADRPHRNHSVGDHSILQPPHIGTTGGNGTPFTPR